MLWAFKTQNTASNFETPSSLTYGTKAMIPVEIRTPSTRTLFVIDNDEELRLNLNLLEERRELALIRENNYKRHIQNTMILR